MTDAALTNRSQRARTIARLGELIGPLRNRLTLIAVLVMLGALLELLPPILMRSIVDDHLTLGRGEGLLVLALLYLGASAFGQGLAFVYGYLAAGAAQIVLARLRVQLFGHLQSLPAAYFDQRPLGDSISRCTADVDTLDTVFSSGIAALVANLVRLITVAAAMVILSPTLSMVAAAVLPVLVLITRFFQVRIRDAERTSRLKVSAMNTHLQETLRGVEVIQAFRREARFLRRFRMVLREVLVAANRATLFSSFYPPVTALMTYSTIALLLWVGTRDVTATFAISVGTLTAFALLLQRFFQPLTALGDEWQAVQGAVAGAERIFEVLALPPDGPRRHRAALERNDGLSCENVVFGYLPHEPILHGVSLRVAPGEHVALVGRSGAGKTSIVQLLAGMYDPWSGRIRVAGRDPRQLADDERRACLGVVPQTAQLFSGTVMENLTLKDARVPLAAVIAAARISGADRFIATLPDGYDTVLRGTGQGRGVQLSAGQEQLLTLTRALTTAPAALLLDEATSLVDGVGEAVLRDALRTQVLARGTAVLTIAHRLSLARAADRVVVIDHGRIVEDGTPADLLARGGTFAALLELEAAGWDWRSA